MNPTITTQPEPAPPRRRRITLTQWILVAMVVGVLFGWLFPAQSQHLQVVSNIFLRLIKCIIVPLIFSTLVVGIAAHGDDLKSVGRLALKSIIYFEVVTTLALVIGLLAVNIIKPGVGVTLPTSTSNPTETGGTKLSAKDMLEHIAPRSFFESAANNDILQVVIFAVIFGLALSQVQGKPKETMVNFFEGVSQVMFKFTGLEIGRAHV